MGSLGIKKSVIEIQIAIPTGYFDGKPERKFRIHGSHLIDLSRIA